MQIWDLASGTLKLSLTGHISTVRGLVVSPRHPYLFSCGEDKQVKCWDLEYNKVSIYIKNDILHHPQTTGQKIWALLYWHQCGNVQELLTGNSYSYS